MSNAQIPDVEVSRALADMSKLIDAANANVAPSTKLANELGSLTPVVEPPPSTYQPPAIPSAHRS